MNTGTEAQSISTNDKFRFTKPTDSRGRAVDGLWERNGRFYYQLSIPGRGCRRVPLVDEQQQPVRTVPAARQAIAELLRNKRKGELPAARRVPVFAEYVKHYLTWAEQTQAKSALTLLKERCALNNWASVLGQLPLNQITRRHVNEFVLARKQKGLSNRTANLDVIALNNLLTFARDERILAGALPTDNWKALEWTPPKRQLISKEQIDRIVTEALRTVDGKPVYLNGEQIADWIKLMAASGARRSSALATRWSDVDWANRQLRLSKTKYGNKIVVDFNADLEAHLKDMFARRLPESDFLFPLVRTDASEGHVVNFQKSFDRIRRAAGLPDFNPHDLRHYFISWCVMSGIDFLTIARWVGHSDGGVLIGEVYGHLTNEHAQRAAGKLTLGQSDAPAPAPDLTKLTVAELLKLLQTAQAKAA